MADAWAGSARPNAELNRKTPAGLRPSPSCLIGPGKLPGVVKPRPQPKPLRPMTAGIGGPNSFQADWVSARSKRWRRPVDVFQPFVVTTRSSLIDESGRVEGWAEVLSDAPEMASGRFIWNVP